MVKKISVAILVLVVCFACSDKKQYSENLNGTWVASDGRTYIFNYPNVEFRPSGEYIEKGQQINKKSAELFGKTLIDEASKGTFGATMDNLEITYTHSMYNGVWKEEKNESVVSFKYKLSNDSLILTNLFGKSMTLKKQE